MADDDEDTGETFVAGEVLPPAAPESPNAMVEANPTEAPSVADYFGVAPPQSPIATDDEPYAADNPDYAPPHPYKQEAGMGEALAELGNGFDFDAGSGLAAGGAGTGFATWNGEETPLATENAPEIDPLNDPALWEEE